ncbi:hypothetical protein AALO_G00119310 [Alosa alosa]|uniref:Zinc finger and BTB domain-containing protein 2 n=1 Tax=Alosa alosa TaxID=278164 RepID=A0AAV6GRU6_9TELE|nr:zinc finger and BTB domain-containing protein 2b isoform X1 [Alosa alosa]XP_048106224.1 zinc finger and BTB domain-containing protein 2b isoform X2 [Alosa alosa]KAG5277585.1 hypothetical protein AALO_G00119310 [Alosa alosa]
MALANHGLVLLQQLNAQREFGFLCDCTVAIGDVFFKAHKAVLAAFSNYFRMLFIHQDSDCVRLKPMDIQPDIFSYLLNLMYTGRLSAQVIDPARLEQGVKFLHAYPLLQDISPQATPPPPPPSHAPAAGSSLYGIQISDQQEALAARLSSPDGGVGGARVGVESEAEFETFGSFAQRGEEDVGMDTAYSDAPSSSSTVSAVTAVAGTIRHVKPSIMQHRSGSFRKQHSCHVCGTRFGQRSALREHLLLHTQQALLLPLVADGGDAPIPMFPGGVATPEMEELFRSGSSAMAAAAITAASSALASDGEQPTASSSATKVSPRPEIPISMYAAIGQPQADTPPPSDIADIDNLEGAADAEREVKRRKYECSTCGRKFIQKSHWREHMYIHTGKPYRCSACGKSFCRANQAARHVCLGQADPDRSDARQVSELCTADDSQLEALFLSTGRQPYRCNVCDATFSSPQQVLKHLCFTQVPYSSNTQLAMTTTAAGGADLHGQDATGRGDEGSDSSSGSRDGAPVRTIKTEEVSVE